MNLSVVTALDLPFPSPGGSVELFLDLYTGRSPLLPARAFMLAPEHRGLRAAAPTGLDLVQAPGKCLTGYAFRRYVTTLQRALVDAVDPGEVGVLHLQHLAFGATPALLRAFPKRPRIALVHGTDLLFAETHPEQLATLREAAWAADVIVVPTGAMADRLLLLAPDAHRRKVEKIPWGIPDRLIASPPPRRRHQSSSHLRILYAGRLTPEKGFDTLLSALPLTQSAELSVAAPRAEFHALRPRLHRHGVHVRYLGWLRRPQLWRTFADHDVLVMPSMTLEAMGLVALEAQACGLPVLYQPVPGLTEALGTTGLATDFADPHAVARAIDRLRANPGLVSALRAAGVTNAARYPLSATVAALAELGRRLA
ncbi:glycosyltransferase family 4 protein [Streptomyces sp. XY152]|uniref:glycosyltransferase family 4 protein n=1 Tax=Streptomyces sp. XY152 TaxID=1415560 RepID=UPI0006AE7030|nr:glycosyltransferase family 4 protein [Streptomyces sp. XY152]KOV19181.1 glycosyltransferase [Streptomyces sp. XY152]